MASLTRREFVATTARGAAVIVAAPLFGTPWARANGALAKGYFEAEFGISDDLCRQVLARALAQGGDYADLYFEHTISNWISLEDGKVNRAYGAVELGVGIRTVKGDQVGYGFTEELTEPAMLGAAAIAASIATAEPTPGPAGAFTTPVLGNFYPVTTPLLAVPLESKVRLVETLNERCCALSPLIVKVNATFHDQEKRIMIVTSDGVKAEDLQPRSFLFSQVTAEKDGRRERAGWNIGGRRSFPFYTTAVADEVATTSVEHVLDLFNAVQPPAGEMPVVLAPGVTGILLHEAIGHGMEADFNRKNVSTYSTMLGKKVAEPSVTIIDDGTVPNMLGSINVDDEGIPARKTTLVADGILTSYLHDRISARIYGVDPTGNGRRESYRHFVQPRMRNTYMLGGPAKPSDVIASVKRGIYVDEVGNGQVKIGEGDFAFYVTRGRMIEDGRLAAPIKDVNIMGNGPKMLANVTMVADDLAFHQGGAGSCGKGGQMVPVGFGLPTILVNSMTVGGSKT